MRTEDVREAAKEEGAKVRALVNCVTKSGLDPKANGPPWKAPGRGGRMSRAATGQPPGGADRQRPGVSSVRGGRTEPQQLTRNAERE